METTGRAQRPSINIVQDARHRYRCNQCRRAFTVASGASHHGSVRCPACLGDDVGQWLTRRDRLLRFLMLYEAG